MPVPFPSLASRVSRASRGSHASRVSRLSRASRAAAATRLARAPLACAALFAAACGGPSDPSSAAVAPAAEVLLLGGAGGSTSAVNAVAILSTESGVALVNDFASAAANRLVPFHPRTGQVAAPVALPTIAFAAGLLDSNGDPAPSTFAATFPGAAVLAGGKLFVSAGNLDLASFASQPGALVVYDRSSSGALVTPGRALVLTDAQGGALYNPSQLIPFTDAQGAARLAVVVCAAFSASPASAVVVVDPASEQVVSRVAIGPRILNSAAAALSQDRRLYLGGGTESELFEVDLDQGAVVGPVAIHTAITTSFTAFNAVSGIALSHDERTLYVASSNNATVSLVDRVTLQETAIASGFARTKTDREAQSLQCFIQALVVRPGEPGVDFAGPECFVATINLDDPVDQPASDVRSAIDTLARGAGAGVAVTIDAGLAGGLTAGPSGDLQQLLVSPSFPGTLFAVEFKTGRLHALPIAP